MDIRISATFSTTGDRPMSPPVGEIGANAADSEPRPASCLDNCGACGTTLVPDGCPQLLPCLHSLCLECARLDRNECPVCGAAYTLAEVIDNLFFKKSQLTTQCGGCGGTGAEGWCVECGEDLCPECVSAHKRVKVTREHTMLPQRPSSVSAPTLYCSLHRDERVNLICQPCDQMTCRECQLTLHRNHRFQFIHEAVAEDKGQIRSLMEELKLQRREVRKSMSELDGRLLGVKDIQNKVNGEVRKTLLRIKEALMKRAMGLANEVQMLCSSERMTILQRREELRKLEERQTYLLSFSDRALDTEGYSTLLSCRRKIQEQLRDAMSHAVSPGDYMMNLTFNCAQEAYSHMASFGNIMFEKVHIASKNDETATSKDPHLIKNQTLNRQGFFTTEVPPTSSPNPPYYCGNTPASSHQSTASAHNLLPASIRPSRTLKSITSIQDLTTRCYNHTTLNSSQVQMAFSLLSSSAKPPPPYSLNHPISPLKPPSGYPSSSSLNSPISPLNPPTSSLNPQTSSLNPQTSSRNPQTSSRNPQTSSLNPPISPLNPPTSPLNPQTSSLNPQMSSLNPQTSSRNPQTSSLNPPISPLNPPTSPLNPQTSSLNPPISPLNAPTSSLNPQTSPLNPQTSPLNLQTSSLNPQTSSLNPQTSPLNLQTSSLNPQTSSLNPQTSPLNLQTSSLNPQTSSLNPQTSSLNPPISPLNPSTSSVDSHSLSRTLCPSSSTPVRPPAPFPPPTQNIAYYPNVSCQTLSLPYLALCPSLPVTIVSLNAAPVIRIPLAPNGQTAKATTPAKPLAASTPDSQTSLSRKIAHAGILPKLARLCGSKPSCTAVGLSSSAKDQTANATYLAPPVKALADSPCERAPPAGDEQERPAKPAAAENEPTSTVVEADIAESAGGTTGDATGDAAHTSDTSPGSGIASPRATGDSVYGPSVNSMDSAGADLQTSTCSPRNTGSNPQNTAQFGQSDPFGCPAKGDRDDDKGADVENEGDDQALNKGDKRCLFPRVSLVQLPISVPPRGCPLPQFRLVTRAGKQEIHLEQIPKENQHFPRSNNQSAVQPATPLLHPPKPPKPAKPAKGPKVRCAICRKARQLRRCAGCGRSFHAECHVTPISATDRDYWECMICEDLLEVEGHQSRVSEQDPAFRLSDQKKCKRLFRTLIAREESALMYRQPEFLSSSSRYVDITLIRDRLLQKMSPAYLPMEFVSDIWLLLSSIQNSPEDFRPLAKLRTVFKHRLRSTFGSSLHPSLLEAPRRKKAKRATGGGEPQGAQAMKRKRSEELPKSSEKNLCQDVERVGGTE